MDPPTLPNKPVYVTYSDRLSMLLTCWKAIFLTPIWAMPVMPLLGLLFINASLEVKDIGLATILLCAAVYFAEDLLKKKIRIANQVLHFGFRQYRISDVVSIGIQYKSKDVLPSKLLLYFRNGSVLKLRLSRLDNTGFKTILKQVERANPQCLVDPVIVTLERCKRTAKPGIIADSEFTALAYHSHRHLIELYHTFTNTAKDWIRLGPVLVCMFATPMWIYFNLAMFKTTHSAWYYGDNPGLLRPVAENLGTSLAYAAGAVGALIWNACPFLVPVMLGLGAMLIYHIVRSAIRPNSIMIQPQSLTLDLRISEVRIPFAEAKWQELVRVCLQGSKGAADEDSCQIALEYGSGKTPMLLNLYALDEPDRQRLLKAIQTRAPQCVIESDVAEALMPRQSRSYTELWLQSMNSAPERKNLEPLGPAHVLAERWEVSRRLGIGGQGTAYLCRDLHESAPDPTVVLKETLLPVFVEDTVRQHAIERFEHEAHMLQKLDHAAIVKLVDFFIEDHRAYLVLEHIEGRTLRQLVSEHGQLEPATVADLALQMCDILAYMHEQGIIHRDFTPDNMILDPHGRLRLLDFNVAQDRQSGTTGTIVGKHSYLPPEQFRGKAVTASDIYAMGATTFYLLTGCDPEPISQSRPGDKVADLDPRLDDFCARATALSLKERFTDTSQARAALTGVASELAPGEDKSVTLALEPALKISSLNLEEA